MKRNGNLCIIQLEIGTGYSWAFIERGKTGNDAIHILNDGDTLIIFDRVDPQEIVWHGDVEFDRYPRFEIPIHADIWVQYLQVGVTLELWGSWFSNENPAILVTN